MYHYILRGPDVCGGDGKHSIKEEGTEDLVSLLQTILAEVQLVLELSSSHGLS